MRDWQEKIEHEIKRDALRRERRKERWLAKKLNPIHELLELALRFLSPTQQNLFLTVLKGGEDANEARNVLLDMLEERGVDVSTLRK